MRNLITKKWRVVIVVFAIIAAIPWLAGYILVYFKDSWNLSSKSNVTDKYDIFRDLLIIFVTIGVGLGVWAYSELRKRIRSQMMEYMYIFKATSNALNSYHDWEEYEYLWLKEKSLTPEVRARIGFAVTHAQDAYEHMLKANEQTRKQNGKLMCDIQSNLAYHLAARQEKSDYQLAHRHAKDVYDSREKYPERKNDYTEVYWWVIIRYASLHQSKHKEEFNHAVTEINKLLSDVEIDDNWKDSVRKKYETLYPADFSSSISA